MSHDAKSTIDARDEAMMRRAITLACEAAGRDEVPVGAVIYQGDQIIAEASNRCEMDDDATAHAELLAIRAASQVIGDWRLEDCTLAVTLEPCPMCAGAIINTRLGRLIYGARDPKAGAIHSLFSLCSDTRLNHQVAIVPDVLAEECGQLLKDFFREKRRLKRAARQANQDQT